MNLVQYIYEPPLQLTSRDILALMLSLESIKKPKALTVEHMKLRPTLYTLGAPVAFESMLIISNELTKFLIKIYGLQLFVFERNTFDLR